MREPVNASLTWSCLHLVRHLSICHSETHADEAPSLSLNHGTRWPSHSPDRPGNGFENQVKAMSQQVYASI